MTKTLTEQWREGTLPDGKYYIKLEPNFAERYDVGYSEGGDFVLYNIEDIEEVLAPVPSYDEFVQQRDFVKDHLNVLIENMNLKRKLEIATNALNGIRDVWVNNPSQFSYIARIANRKAKTALEKMEGVK